MTFQKKQAIVTKGSSNRMEQKKETLLIVDDSKLQRVVLMQALKDAFELIEATSGEECLELVERGEAQIDLVLLDLVMPGIDGFEVLRRRALSPKFAGIPVVVLTTSDDNETQVEAFRLGAREFLNKPVKPEIAVSRINNVLESQRRLNVMLKEQEELKVKAEIDEMTKLLNKATAEKMAKQILEEYPDENHAILMIDIDNFKNVNDSLGHDVGDHVISVVAGIISMQFGGSDIVGRIGGDEFMVFMKDVKDREDARRKAQNIVDALCKKENLSIPDCVSVSIGMAFSDESGIEYEPLFKKADEALYVSKEKGKSCYTEYSKIGQITFEDSHTILVWTKCRNLLSTIELIFRQPLQVESVSSIEELCDLYQKKKQQTIAIYVDVSETLDDGEEMWKLLSNQPWAKSMTIVAVCHEGNMSQVKNSVLAGLAADLLFAPLEQGQLKRRLREYQKHKKETEK